MDTYVPGLAVLNVCCSYPSTRLYTSGRLKSKYIMRACSLVPISVGTRLVLPTKSRSGQSDLSCCCPLSAIFESQHHMSAAHRLGMKRPWQIKDKLVLSAEYAINHAMATCRLEWCADSLMAFFVAGGKACQIPMNAHLRLCALPLVSRIGPVAFPLR